MSSTNITLTQEVREIDYIERHPRLVIVIPAYNSARHIGSTVAQALSYAQQVIVVDDASDDATAEIAYQAGATVVQHQQHTGSSEAIATAFGKAREYTPDMIVVLPGSSQHSTSDLSSVLQPVRDATADIVIGTREAEDTSETRPIYAFSARAFQVLSFCADGFATEEALRSLADEYDLQCVGVRSEHTPPRPPHTRHMEGLPRLNQPYRPLFLLGSVGGMLMLLGTFPGTWGIQFEQSTHSFVSGYSFFNIVLILVSACLIGVGFLLYLTRNITFAQHAQSSTDA